jgi:hypothetical protein
MQEALPFVSRKIPRIYLSDANIHILNSGVVEFL